MQHFLSKGFCNQKSSRRSSLLSISVSELGAGAGDQHRSAPATSGTLAELQIFKKWGKCWKNGQLRSNSAPAEFLIFN